MDDSLGVRGDQRVGDLLRHPQLHVAAEPLADGGFETAPGDQLEHQEVLRGELDVLVDAADVGMVEVPDSRRVFAVFEQPDLKSVFTFHVRAPRDWVVVSNAVAEDAPANGEPGTWRFVQTAPMSTYITALVAGPYAHVHEEHDGKCHEDRAEELGQRAHSFEVREVGGMAFDAMR